MIFAFAIQFSSLVTVSRLSVGARATFAGGPCDAWASLEELKKQSRHLRCWGGGGRLSHFFHCLWMHLRWKPLEWRKLQPSNAKHRQTDACDWL